MLGQTGATGAGAVSHPTNECELSHPRVPADAAVRISDKSDRAPRSRPTVVWNGQSHRLPSTTQRNQERRLCHWE
jgi:hypothetical protein